MRYRWPFLGVVAGLTVFFGLQCLDLQVDGDNRSMDADNRELEELEARFESLFSQGDSILVAVHGDDLPGPSGRDLVRELDDEFSSIEGVRSVASLADSNFEAFPYQEGLVVSADGRTTGLELSLSPTEDDEDLERIRDSIQGILDRHASASFRFTLTGLPIQKLESARLVLRDQKIFSPLSFLVLGTVLLVVTKRRSGMLIPLLVSGVTICWTLGIYSLLGYSLNMITSLLPPVIMTLGVATTIHLYMDWLHETGTDNPARIAKALHKLARPCLFATLTTAIGLLSLLLSPTPAVRHFGLFAAIGALFAFLLGITGLVCGLSFLRPPEVVTPTFPPRTGPLDTLLGATARLSIRHPGKVVLVTLLLMTGSLLGLSRIVPNTDLLRYLGKDSQLYVDTRFIDRELTGTNAIELLLEQRGETRLSLDEQLERMEAFAEAVEGLPRVRHVLGLADLVAAARGKIPPGIDVPLEHILGELETENFWNESDGALRMTVRTESIGSREGAGLIRDIRTLAESELGPGLRLELTGDFYRVVVESNELVRSQLKSFGVALVLILVSIGIVFRSLAFAVLAILPNVAPLLLTGAIMEFAGIDLSTGTSMIASVVIGLAVDDSIHYLSAYRRRSRDDLDSAIDRTTRSTGRPLVATTLALSTGFWVALFGSFEPTVYFALLTGLTMWFALVFDLLVLPSCLELVLGRKKSTTPDS